MNNLLDSEPVATAEEIWQATKVLWQALDSLNGLSDTKHQLELYITEQWGLVTFSFANFAKMLPDLTEAVDAMELIDRLME